jgi:hypothetical protein
MIFVKKTGFRAKILKKQRLNSTKVVVRGISKARSRLLEPANLFLT